MAMNFVSVTDRSVEDKYPAGIFITLQPRYTAERNCVLRLCAPVSHLTDNLGNELGSVLIAQLECYHPDGGRRYLERYLIWQEKDINIIVDPRDEEYWALVALSGIKM